MDNLRRRLYARKANSDFQRSLLKATFDRDNYPPKEKHVQIVIQTLSGQNQLTSKDQAISDIQERFLTGKWVSILKTELILHISLNSLGVAHCQKISKIYFFVSNQNESSKIGDYNWELIKDYYEYISWIAYNRRRPNLITIVQNKLQFIKSSSNENLLEEVSCLINQVKSFISVASKAYHSYMTYYLPIVFKALHLILKESCELTKFVDLGISQIEDRFSNFSVQEAKAGLELYKKFSDLSGDLVQVNQFIVTLQLENVQPNDAKGRPEEIFFSMQSFLNQKIQQENIRVNKMKGKFFQGQTLNQYRVSGNIQNSLDIFDTFQTLNQAQQSKQRELYKDDEQKLLNQLDCSTFSSQQLIQDQKRPFEEFDIPNLQKQTRFQNIDQQLLQFEPVQQDITQNSRISNKNVPLVQPINYPGAYFTFGMGNYQSTQAGKQSQNFNQYFNTNPNSYLTVKSNLVNNQQQQTPNFQNLQIFGELGNFPSTENSSDPNKQQRQVQNVQMSSNTFYSFNGPHSTRNNPFK